MATLNIFDVEHGSCSLLQADTGARIMIDCGWNPKSGWSPTQQLIRDGAQHVDLLVITNYDEDHVDGLPELRQSGISIRGLWRPKNVEPDDIIQLKSEDGMGNGIAELVNMARTYVHPLSPIDFGNVQRQMFYNPPGSFDDENNLSAIVVLTINGIKVVFPGDMERAGFDLILARQEVKDAISGASVLVAPHHGRECSVHEGFLGLVRPFWTVISDKGYMYDTQETVPTYSHYSRGGQFRGRERYVLTTRADGSITFSFTEGGWGAS
jgi:beta-lactamase superfamily II metal-dependent hydrolase